MFTEKQVLQLASEMPCACGRHPEGVQQEAVSDMEIRKSGYEDPYWESPPTIYIQMMRCTFCSQEHKFACRERKV